MVHFLSTTTIAPVEFSTDDVDVLATIATAQDTDYEHDGIISVELVEGEGYLVEESAKKITIMVLDNDIPQGVSIIASQAAVVEGTDAIFLVKSAPPATEKFLVQFGISQGDADILPTDLSLIPTIVTFEIDESVQEVRIPTVADESR